MSSYHCVSAVGVGIWDMKFGIFHSWVPLPDARQATGQVRKKFHGIYSSSNYLNLLLKKLIILTAFYSVPHVTYF